MEFSAPVEPRRYHNSLWNNCCVLSTFQKSMPVLVGLGLLGSIADSKAICELLSSRAKTNDLAGRAVTPNPSKIRATVVTDFPVRNVKGFLNISILLPRE